MMSKAAVALGLAIGAAALGGVWMLSQQQTSPRPKPPTTPTYTPPPWAGGNTAPNNGTNPPTNDNFKLACQFEKDRAAAISSRDIAKAEVGKILDGNFAAAAEAFCKSKTLWWLPGAGVIDMSNCMNEAAEYVRTGNRGEYYGVDPGLRALRDRWAKSSSTVAQAENRIAAIDAELKKLAAAGFRCPGGTA